MRGLQEVLGQTVVARDAQVAFVLLQQALELREQQRGLDGAVGQQDAEVTHAVFVHGLLHHGPEPAGAEGQQGVVGVEADDVEVGRVGPIEVGIEASGAGVADVRLRERLDRGGVVQAGEADAEEGAEARHEELHGEADEDGAFAQDVPRLLGGEGHDCVHRSTQGHGRVTTRTRL